MSESWNVERAAEFLKELAEYEKLTILSALLEEHADNRDPDKPENHSQG